MNRFIVAVAELCKACGACEVACPVQIPLPELGHATWFATPENRWSETIVPWLPKWLTVTNHRALEGFYYGHNDFYRPEFYRPWLPETAIGGTDDRAPPVAIASPKDGARLRSQPIAVSGTASGGTGIVVTVNGQPATLSGTDFSVASVPLNEGANTLTARATNDAGKQGVAAIAVTLDDVAPTVKSTSPVEGSTGVPLATVVRVVFSEPIDPATAVGANIGLSQDGGGPVAGQLSLDSDTIAFVPDAALADKSSFTLTVGTGVGAAQGALDFFGCRRARENKARVARALRPGDQLLAGLGGDHGQHVDHGVAP